MKLSWILLFQKTILSCVHECSCGRWRREGKGRCPSPYQITKEGGSEMDSNQACSPWGLLLRYRTKNDSISHTQPTSLRVYSPLGRKQLIPEIQMRLTRSPFRLSDCFWFDMRSGAQPSQSPDRHTYTESLKKLFYQVAWTGTYIVCRIMQPWKSIFEGHSLTGCSEKWWCKVEGQRKRR